ncbi:hypothetical protein DEO72_LG5g1378 [Vigna unguiculata]|uniref:Uncharacterized protein n=1 Tax=Vigna unguiculata TaxID=3917 RepID=A0A4D6LX90_VIGUN|nr:hypothetical protein DEO72_LG5g1378 [Vigna unguiculata]
MSPQSRGHWKNAEGCLHRAEVISRMQKDVSIEPRSLQDVSTKVEVIVGIQKDVSTKPRSL